MVSLILNTQIDTFLKVRHHRTQDILIYWQNNFLDSILSIYNVIWSCSENIILYTTPKEKNLKEPDRGPGWPREIHMMRDDVVSKTTV